ncbi:MULTISPECIES: hypothetical protein [unclassified Kitasatospora]|uniref:hypothetical protein n=1 Tax=unclassified Kitasatospora TaxID=2633591 RepID=UPI00070E45A2|nr:MULTISPECIES: hypothetical protein [unclassified Kitasatospora]KQV23917.1 hypothetical protein ASC99_01510 [Kitasatospora sp. Root107]KRB67371.1 hypothetical protein ASE03_03225 [Kitasatospora sp. Root187]
MADTETTTETPAELQPVAEAAPAEQNLTAVDPEAQLLEVLEVLATDEPETAPEADEPKKDGGYEPLGNIINRP